LVAERRRRARSCGGRATLHRPGQPPRLAAPHDERPASRAESALRTKLTAAVLQVELSLELATDPRLRAHLEAALRAARAAAELLQRR
jgi:hypothetical protein